MLSKQVSNENIKRLHSRNSQKRLTLVFLFGVFLVLGMIFSGWVRWKQTEIVFRINQLKDEKQEVLDLKKTLSLKLHQLEALERVNGIARKTLGMMEIDPSRIINVDVKADTTQETNGETAAADDASGGETQ
jgi:hypothetical protein